nr:hypothetical protein [Candidatus Sigynarchaeota archaeon]
MQNPTRIDALKKANLGLCPRLSFHDSEPFYTCADGSDCCVEHCPSTRNGWSRFHANLFVAIMNDFESRPENETETRLDLKFALRTMDASNDTATTEQNLQRLTAMFFSMRNRDPASPFQNRAEKKPEQNVQVNDDDHGNHA